MDKNELKINVQRKVTNILSNAFPLSIILADSNLLPWFYENYVQLYFCENQVRFAHDAWLDFYGGWTYPRQVLFCKEYHRRIFENIDILEFVTGAIDDGYYVFTYADEFELRGGQGILRHHFTHDVFIYGYDKLKSSLLGLGFDNDGIFNQLTFDFATFEHAFRKGISLTSGRDWNLPFSIYAVLFKAKFPDTYKYHFKLENFLTQLEDYLNSNDPGKRIDPIYYLYKQSNNVYGLNVYDRIETYVEGAIKNKVTLDYKVFHTLYEHKVILKERLDYLGNMINSNIITLSNDFQTIVTDYQKLRVLAGKYILGGKYHVTQTLQEILNIIQHQRGNEEKILGEVYKNLYRTIQSGKESMIKMAK